MDRLVLNFLKEYSFDTLCVDRLIVSSFLKGKDLFPESDFLKTYEIREGSSDYEIFLKFSELAKFDNLETVIEAFEYVISPKDKIVTGAVYTPIKIRKYITEQILSKTLKSLNDIIIADIACGCGGFLMTAAQWLHQHAKKSYSKIIEENIWGLDIASYSITRSKIILTLLALENGEKGKVKFNLFTGNALSFVWNIQPITDKGGFDVIIGNPPYVASRNIDQASRQLLINWEVTQTGHPDLYIPFFQIGMKSLAADGVLGYITVNTFFKSINGRALREYFSKEKFDLTIIDFRGEQVFKKKSTYTCLCFIQKRLTSTIRFHQTTSQKLHEITDKDFHTDNYENLTHYEGWNLAHPKSLDIIHCIERFETKIFTNFTFSTGIATLKNSVFKFKKVGENTRTYLLKSGNEIFEIEKRICREIINANKITTEEEIENLKEKLIFPYNYNPISKRYQVKQEQEFRNSFPLTYEYLSTKIKDLENRDKGLGKYDTWYAYGRNQGLQITGIKLFLPHITDDPRFVISHDRNLMFCNGEAIISNNENELLILKKILESELFWYYILKTSKPYSSNYFSLSKNYLKKFSIPEFTAQEHEFLLNENNESKLLSFLLKKYGLTESIWDSR